MSGKKQVWYIEGSAAAALAAPLHAHYDLHPVPQNNEKDARALLSAGSNSIPSVWLADINALGEISNPQPAAHPNKNRVIAIFSADGAPKVKSNLAGHPSKDHAIFAFLPSFAPSNIVERTLEAAFDNIELVERDRASNYALKIWERER